MLDTKRPKWHAQTDAGSDAIDVACLFVCYCWGGVLGNWRLTLPAWWITLWCDILDTQRSMYICLTRCLTRWMLDAMIGAGRLLCLMRNA